MQYFLSNFNIHDVAVRSRKFLDSLTQGKIEIETHVNFCYWHPVVSFAVSTKLNRYPEHLWECSKCLGFSSWFLNHVTNSIETVGTNRVLYWDEGKM